MDAADLTDQAAFDHVRWSQFFFPAPGTPPHEVRAAARNRLLFAAWGVPVRSADELGAEVTAAGFQVLQALALPPRPAGPGPRPAPRTAPAHPIRRTTPGGRQDH
jgi:hypothetical protein